MATLTEKQFELDGVVFGLNADVEVTNWDPGTPATRAGDVENPTGDGVRFGRDFKGSATWNFSMFVNGENEDDGWEKLAALAEAWDGDWVREEPDRVVALRYRVAGKNRVVFGRPRAWTAVVNNASMSGRIDVEAQFVLVDHRIYGDEMHTQIVRLVAPLEEDAGLIPPFDVPFVSEAGSAEVEDGLTIGGRIATPIILTFLDPIDQPAVRIGDWTAALEEPVQEGLPVTIDARPWVRSATTSAGGGVRVSPRVTRISKMWLKPGHYPIVFTGNDPSGSASVLVSWREAFRTPR